MNARAENLAGKPPLGLKQPKAKKNPKHLARVAELPCVICHEYGMAQLSPTQVHHCIHGRNSQEKRPDEMTIPLCEGHHTGLMDTSKVAIHKASKSWAVLYGEDTRWISWVEDRLSSRGQKFVVRGVCEVEGCGRRQQHNGFCGPHYRRNLKYGDPKMGGTMQGGPVKWIEENKGFLGDECLAWPFSASEGYYSIYVNLGHSKAHRLMCEAAHGPAAEGMLALHSCGNKSCVNPRHLRWGTHKENTRDAMNHGTFRFGDKSPASKISEADVRLIREKWAQGKTLSEIAADLPITPSAVWAIARRKAWKHVE